MTVPTATPGDRLVFFAACVLVSLAVTLTGHVLAYRLGWFEHHCRSGRYVVREFRQQLIFDVRADRYGHLQTVPLWMPAYRQMVWTCPHSDGGP